MTRNLKKLICVLLAVTLLCVASAMVFAEINKSTDEPSATPVDENAGRIDTSAEDIEVQSAPIKVKPASIAEASPFPKDARVCSLDNTDEPAQVIISSRYSMVSNVAIFLPDEYEVPDNYIVGFADMLADMEFIPVSGDTMVDEAKKAMSNRENEAIWMTLYSEDGNEILNVAFCRSTEDAVWLPYIRILEPLANITTDEEYYEELEKLKGQSWETGLYMINPETMDAQILETMTTMALGGSFDECIDFAGELRTIILNSYNTKSSGNNMGNSKYGLYSYYMERFPYANIVD